MLVRFWRSTSGVVVLATLGFTAATLVVGVIAYEVTHEALEEQLNHRIATETVAIITEARNAGLAELARAVRRRDSVRSASSLRYLLVDEEGGRLAGTLVADIPANRYEELLAFRDSSTGRSGIAQALTTRIADGALIVAADRANLQETDRTLLKLFSGATAAILVVGVTAATSVGWVTRRRLSKIGATANAIIQGDLSRRVPRDGTNNEFDQLADTLNQMLTRINMLMDNLRQVSTDVAHDLRTPLTRLSNRLEIALSENDIYNLKGQVTSARADAEELLELFSSLLRIAEIEGMAERLPKQMVDLSALVQCITEIYRPDMEGEQRQFMVTIETGVSVAGDKQLISQLITNLLDNALRHTPRGTVVELRLNRNEDQAILAISDNGPGVDPDETTSIFQRFVRGEKSRSNPGHGLGLAIVASIATAHGGDAMVSSSHPFEIRVLFPLPVQRGKNRHQKDDVDYC